MSVYLSLDAVKLRENLKEFEEKTGIETEDVVRQEVGSTLRTVIRYMPPDNLAQGRKAVERDIRKLFTSPADLFAGESRIPKLRDAIKSRQWDTAAAIIKRIPALSHLTATNEVSAGYHQSQKNRRGQVVKGRTPTILIKNPAVLKRYIREVQKRVGAAKASWLAGLNRWAKNVTQPSWVTRHGAGEGSAADRLRRGRDGYLEASSGNVAANELDQRLNITFRATENCERAMTIRINKTLEKYAKQLEAAR